ncbi:unnamed protein product, partial [Staurois parvus]
MTGDCGHSTGDDQRLQTHGPATQLCSGTLPVPLSSGALSSGFCSVGTGHDSRVPSAHAHEAVLFVNGKAVPGTHDRSQKPPDQ